MSKGNVFLVGGSGAHLRLSIAVLCGNHHDRTSLIHLGVWLQCTNVTKAHEQTTIRKAESSPWSAEKRLIKDPLEVLLHIVLSIAKLSEWEHTNAGVDKIK